MPLKKNSPNKNKQVDRTASYRVAGSRKDTDKQNIAFRFRAYPTKEQEAYFSRVFGCCRFLWNTFLGDDLEHIGVMGTRLGNTPADYKDIYPFLSEVDNYALCNVQKNYNKAWKAYYAGNNEKPGFKKKGKCKESFTTNVSHGNIRLCGDGIRLPLLPGKVLPLLMHREVPDGMKMKSVTVTREPDGSYYASILYEYEAKTTLVLEKEAPLKTVGLDMSMKELFVSSDGEMGDYPRYFRESEDRLAKAQRKLSRMEKGSNNYLRQKEKVAKIHAVIKHQRRDFLHKLSSRLVCRYDVICIEDLDMHAMAQTLNLGKSVSDNGWGTFVRMLEYKCRHAGKYIVKIGKWVPSSQACSVCGYLNKDVKDLSVRKWYCPSCGAFHDRDANAAQNILQEGLSIYYSSAHLAC